MKRYKPFKFEESSKFEIKNETTILNTKLNISDIIPIYNWKQKKFIECVIIDIEYKDINNTWKFFPYTNSLIDFVIYYTPTNKRKNIYKDCVFKDGRITTGWHQVNTSDTYNSKTIKDFAITYRR